MKFNPKSKYCRWEIYGHGYSTFWRFVRIILIRQICSLMGHPKAGFHACTCVEPLPDGVNANIGVSLVCPVCYYSKAGDVKSGL